MSLTDGVSRHRMAVRWSVLTVFSLVLALLVYWGLSDLGLRKLEEYASSDRYARAIRMHLEQINRDLQTFISDEKLALADIGRIEEWERDNPSVSIIIYDGERLVHMTGLPVSDEGDMPDVHIEGEDVYSLRFTDGEVSASLNDFAIGMQYEHVVRVGAAVLALAAFLLPTAVFARRKIRYMEMLRERVDAMGGGDFTSPVPLKGKDEIYALAYGMDRMRQSLMHQHEEEGARQAAQELVTAVSHDLRTPLTSLMGYLDLVEQKKYKSDEEMRRFIAAALKKSMQIKEMTDKLFGYFYVYTSQEEETPLTRVPAARWLDQALGEHVLDLESAGFRVTLDREEVQGDFFINESLLVRVLGNLFGNIQKHADPDSRILARLYAEDGRVHLKIINRVSARPARESTRVGLKTCARAPVPARGV